MVQKSGVHSPVDRLLVYPIIYKVLFTSQVVVWDFFHQQFFILARPGTSMIKTTPISEEKPRQTSCAPSPPSAALLDWSAPLQKKKNGPKVPSTSRKPQPTKKITSTWMKKWLALVRNTDAAENVLFFFLWGSGTPNFVELQMLSVEDL